MNSTSEKTSLIILAITALLLSRSMFVFFDDPEGPNLLIVALVAVVVYFLSLTTCWFNSIVAGPKKSLLAILVQILIVTCAGLLLR